MGLVWRSKPIREGQKFFKTHLFPKKEPTHIWILDGWGGRGLAKIKE
jgi:hypothetical protein